MKIETQVCLLPPGKTAEGIGGRAKRAAGNNTLNGVFFYAYNMRNNNILHNIKYFIP